MKKIIIPRRDHEVYFIPVPEALKPKLIRSFVVGQMERLHPGFSGEAAMDVKRLVFDKTRWVMATVMEAETLAEYKVLYKGAAFFTNTSIAVYNNNFIRDGVQTILDERIGYDSERRTPVSIPLEPCKSEGLESPPKTVKNVPRKRGVFAGRMPVWRVTVMVVCAALSVLIPLFFFPAAKEAEETIKVPFTVKTAEPAAVQKYPPGAIEILAEFSSDLLKTGGKISRWQYNEDSSPLVTIETRGIDILSLHNILSQYRYVVLEDILDVRYVDGEAYLTAALNAVRKGYLSPLAGTFFSQGFSLPIFSDLTNELKRNGISVVSETLPSAENGNALYTVTFTAKDRALVRSMETITGICDKYPVRVKGMDVLMAGESNRFTVVCSLAQSDSPRYAVNSQGDEKAQFHWDSVPKAFGYRDDPPPPKAAVTAAVKIEAPREQTPQAREITPEVSIVGMIRDDRGQILFYREVGDNKIKIKDTP